MRILLTTFGSYGDLFPYLALGRELHRRGHEVTVATSAVYQSKVAAVGLGFRPVRPDVSLDDREMLAYVMDAQRGSERVVRYLASVVRESYEDTLDAASWADLIVTHPITFASVVAAQQLRKRWVSSILAPISFLSIYDPPVVAPAPWMRRLNFLGPNFARMWISLGKRQGFDWVRAVFDLRAELGLGPSANPLFEGQHSPALVIALFSPLLAAPQPDWPSHTIVTGFCFFEDGTLSDELQNFLDSGSPPVVFTLGSSAVGTAGDFYRHSLNAIQRLGVRAVLLTGSHPQGLPETLPDHILRASYAPHAELFPRAAAIVHQGGIGTTAQALRAGRPMLIVPFAHDQFDNAERVRRLAAAEVLPRSRYTGQRAEGRLRLLMSRPSYAEATARAGGQVRAEDGTRVAADAIERMR